ncbi:RagB/SusD family nutrient uptake outer membrane protein [Pedobacter gandavensis]|uniref:RagB/SusD family nutrient uptake outer membrane protein n=1 Tax=Pedobacter gandavensis TaxID=2679963 RepID=UPI00292FBE87|nr:RagB/SusD family nutrient uptake outer membrane protein [Pedobacter gandavensis]
MKKFENTKYLFSLVLLISLFSCKKYLNVVPDNVATIDYAFRSRDEAEKYLFTCYSFLPKLGNPALNPGIMASDEFAVIYPALFSGNLDTELFAIPTGSQNIVSPYANYWDGGTKGVPYFQAIRNCNVFFENINKVNDLGDLEKKRWIAEVKFLKAYYHYWLLRMYGPIPIIKVNKPISSSIEEVLVYRDPVDEVTNYIVSLLDEASPDLPNRLMSEASELGRITRGIALSVKAEVLVTMASPLFNGNPDYAGFKDKRGLQLFNPTFMPEKWEKAKFACKAAIDNCAGNGLALYYYKPRINTYDLSEETKTQMSVRAAVTEKWNSEIIWAASNSYTTDDGHGFQKNAQAQLSPVGFIQSIDQNLAVPIKMADLFYSKNGVPIEEDPSFNYAQRLTKLRVAVESDRYNIKVGVSTAEINFDRENRFYADLGFDGGVWYGSGQLDDKNPYYVQHKLGQTAGVGNSTNYNPSGYFPKKLVNYANSINPDTRAYTVISYPWPVMRLGELYLMYAEALNESEGPSAEAYKYIDLVRKRAGLNGIVASYAAHSIRAGKPGTKEGLRIALQRESLIEMALEGKRFWNIRRWKTAADYLNQPFTGWNILGTTDQTYYRVKVLHQGVFKQRDYLFPISENSIIANKNLVQNPGW